MSNKLNKRLAFYRIDRTADGQGGKAKSADLLGMVWGSLNPFFGQSEVFQNRKITTYQEVRGSTRQLLDFTPQEKDIIVLSGIQYLIMGLQDVGIKGVEIKYNLRRLGTQEFVNLTDTGIFSQVGAEVFGQTGQGIFSQVG